MSVLHQQGTNTVDGATYTYDNAGNRLSKQNLLNNVTEHYDYDAIYELKHVIQDLSGGGQTTTESYTYDQVGNRLSALNIAQYNYDSSNHLNSSSDGVSYTYDNNGNTLTKADTSGTTQYAWDFENRLASVTLPGAGGVVTFKYDPFGRRIQKSSGMGATNFAYDGASIVAELSSAGAVTAKYAQGSGIDQQLAMYRNGVTALYDADGLGSVTSLYDTAGVQDATYGFASFGTATSTGTLLNPFQYTGREWDSETGIYYYRARYYDVRTGRFVSEDPKGFEAGLNFYTYVDNRPANLTDPFGLTPAPVASKEAIQEVIDYLEQQAAQDAQALSKALGHGIGAAAMVISVVLGNPTELNPGEQDWINKQKERCAKGKWKCKVRCALINIRTGSAESYVETDGYGSSEREAFQDAQKTLQNGTPPGYRTRHCHTVGRCEKQ